MHDALGTGLGSFPAFLNLTYPPVPPAFNSAAAVSGAARYAARALYPTQSDQIEKAFLAVAPGLPQASLNFGEGVARLVIQARQNDRSDLTGNYSFNPAPGHHKPDPFYPGQGALGPLWGRVMPFTFKDPATDTKMKGPRALNSNDYAMAFNEVKKFGRDNLPSFDEPKAVEGIFWAYDGAQKLGTPPRLYNQIALAISGARNPTEVNDARLLTLINVGMADAGIAAWHWKYHFDFWRPVVGIREADAGTGTSGLGDGNAATKGDAFWAPLGAPDTNGNRVRNFTPGFPAYPSGHSVFGSTCFNLIQEFYGVGNVITFEFVSDEFDGRNRDSTNVVRPRISKSFDLKSAIKSNADSRVWLGVHWRFDSDDGIDLGKTISNLAFAAFGRPAHMPGPAGAAVIPGPSIGPFASQPQQLR